MNWEMLVENEPRLQQLLEDIESIQDDPEKSYFCANELWIRIYKKRLIHLVGMAAEKNNDILRSSQAYDLASKKLFEILPNCRNCTCL